MQSVERAFELLEILADAGSTAALGELASRAELPQPTIHRLVRTLLAMGYCQATAQLAVLVGAQADPAGRERGAAHRRVVAPASGGFGRSDG